MLGKYQIIEPLGRGGMARVYRAYHAQLDRYVAVKVLRADLADDATFLARFQREARSVASLRHPNIVQVYDFDVQDDLYYMVMELLQGDSLKARLNDYRVRGEHMPISDSLHILLDVLAGLAYAHAQGMIHRDIKPANIMLTQDGQAVLADFGIAQIIGGTQYTVSGALMGTLNYMAPEQGLKGSCDARSDIYSLGIVLYEMLTHTVPFDADTPLAILMKHLNDPPPNPRQIEPTIPAPIEQVLLKALAKQPEDRYQSAEEMAQAVRAALEACQMTLPGRISLPLSFTTIAAPSEPVAVFSGTARRRIQDDDLDQGDTDVSLGTRLGESTNPLPPNRRPHWERSARPAAEAVQAAPLLVKRLALSAPLALRQSGERAVQRLDMLRQKAESAPRPPLWMVILGSIWVMLACNMLSFTTGGLLGRNVILGPRGWPIQLLMAGLILSGIAASRQSIRMLIPAGIVVGNGLLLSYYAVTGNWYHWTFLWPLEPMLVIGVIMFTLYWAARPVAARQISYFSSLGLIALCLGASSLIFLLALVLPA